MNFIARMRAAFRLSVLNRSIHRHEEFLREFVAPMGQAWQQSHDCRRIVIQQRQDRVRELRLERDALVSEFGVSPMSRRVGAP